MGSHRVGHDLSNLAAAAAARGSLVAQLVRNSPAMQETLVGFLSSSVLNFTGLDLAHHNSCPSEVIWTTFGFTCQPNYACLPTRPTAFIKQLDKKENMASQQTTEGPFLGLDK